MTVERDPVIEEDPSSGGGAEGLSAVTGRTLNLAFVKSTLRRRVWVWVACALAGLALGAGYHVVVPVNYWATATLYLAHAPDSNNTLVANNDLAMLDTAAVGDRALAILGKKGVTPIKFLGKQPGTVASDNVLLISIDGATSKAAVQRVDAVATAYLEFRAQEYRQQNDAVVAAARQEANDLKAKIDQYSAEIASGGGTNAVSTSTLVAARATATTELTTLQQSIQQDDIVTDSIVRGSRVITPGTSDGTSTKKVFALDGLSGLAGGLGLGLFLVIAEASLSDLIRRREDLAAVLGAPVVLSVGHVKRRRFGLLRRSVLDLASRDDPRISQLGQCFKELSDSSGGAPLMIVAADDPVVPAAAVMAVAARAAQDDRHIVVVDATDRRVVASRLSPPDAGASSARSRSWRTVTVVAPTMPWDGTGGAADSDTATVRHDDVAFVLATFGPATGAWHLRRWASSAVVTVSSGTSTVQKVATTAELLDAAGIGVKAAVLLDSDPRDDSLGLPVPGAGAPAAGLRLDVVRTPPSGES